MSGSGGNASGQQPANGSNLNYSQNMGQNNNGASSSGHSNHPSYISNNPSVNNGQSNPTNNSTMGVSTQNVNGGTAVATNYSNLSNFMSMNTSSSVQNSDSHPSGQGERINHSSPTKTPGSNPTTAGITGVTGVGSQNPSIQGSAGGVSNNGRPSMT